MIINVYCRNFGWLFEDLKWAIASVADDVIASEDPLPEADAWICIRTDEAHHCPDPARCVVQVHDFYTHSPLTRYGAVSLVHPAQRETCQSADQVHVQPIGARRLFTLRESMPERFTVGWVGRDVTHQGRHIKRPQLFVDAVLEARRQGCDVVAEGRSAGHPGGRAESLRDFYHSIDALVVTCEPEPGPLSIYEALACGVPVISTKTGALDNLAGNKWGYESAPEHLADAITDAGECRSQNFARRAEIRASVTHWQDDWCRAQVELARSLCA